jgi:hypothetical protein
LADREIGSRNAENSVLGRLHPVAILASEGPLMAVSCHWLSDVVYSRYAPESSRSQSVDFNKLKGCKRPIAEVIEWNLRE